MQIARRYPLAGKMGSASCMDSRAVPEALEMGFGRRFPTPSRATVKALGQLDETAHWL